MDNETKNSETNNNETNNETKTNETKNKERRLRRQAQQMGLALKKSRGAKGEDNQGGYRLQHAEKAIAMAGHKFELNLEEVEIWMMQHSAELMP